MKFRIPPDKMGHYIAGQVAYIAAFLLAYLIGLGWLSNYFGMVGAIAAGILKEVYDKHNDGNVELKDAIATVIGGLVLFAFNF